MDWLPQEIVNGVPPVPPEKSPMFSPSTLTLLFCSVTRPPSTMVSWSLTVPPAEKLTVSVPPLKSGLSTSVTSAVGTRAVAGSFSV